MDYKNKLWMFFIAAALLTLLMKCVKYVFHNKDEGSIGRKKRELLAEWFFEASSENAVSWVATVGVVWCCGFLLIEKTDLLHSVFGEWIKYFPLSCPIAALFGSLSELGAPDLAKKILGKLTSLKLGD